MRAIKMENIFTKTILSLSAFIVLGFISFASCTIGLGEAVDMTAPEVKIIAPFARESVPSLFDVSGTVSDNIDVTELVLTVGENVWRYYKGAWFFNDVSYKDAIWETVEKGSYKWTVKNVFLVDDGEYAIRVNAYDEARNTSENSVAQRTVIYDMHAPKVSISYPYLYETNDKIHDALDKYSGPTGYRDYSKIDNFINGSFKITGNQEEVFSLKYLRVYIADVDNNELWSSPLYTARESYIDEIIEDGFFTEAEKNENKYVITSAIRSFSLNVPELSSITEKTYLKIITVSSDLSGNIEYTEDGDGNKTYKMSQGFFCYYPAADRPWIEFDMASDTPETAYDCYPGTKLQGYSYDDDGIQTVKATITNTSTSEKKEVVLYERGESEEASTYQTWSVASDTSNAVYKIDIIVIDTNGVSSEVKSGYFRVVDINFPSLTINAPEKEKTLFGNSNGDFTFDITASDDSGVEKVLCVYLNEESDAAYYLNASDARWSNVTSANTIANPYKDANGNILWYITLKNEPDSISGGRKHFTPAEPFKLNIFSDLGIGTKRKLDGQHFVFYIEDQSENRLAYDYSIQGDVEAPTISIDTLSVDGVSREISEIEGKTQTDITDGKTITLSGTWKENSIAVWNDTNKFSDFGVYWNKEKLDVTITHTGDGSGTWTSTFEYSASKYSLNAGSVVSLSAYIEDYAKNSNIYKASFTTDNELPVLENVTSPNPNKSYGIDEEIIIRLKFNKTITVKNSPQIKLNNGAEAIFVESTNDSMNLDFKYTVALNDDVKILNVVSISDDTDDTFKASGVVCIPKFTENNDLAKNKKISIVTTSPKLETAEIADGKLILDFSSDITKGNGDITITQKDVTNVPVVLSETEYRKWLNKDPAIATFYKAGTNGASSSGEADLTTKYILDFDKDSDSNDVVKSYIDADMHEVTVSVKSSAITVSGSSLKLDLSKYPLPCKGVDYTVKIDNKIVTNVVNNGNENDSIKEVSLGGVETPVIRINKSKAEFDDVQKTAKQPLQSEIKIDCETPGVTIFYGMKDKKFDYNDAKTNLGSKDNHPYPVKGDNPERPVPTIDFSKLQDTKIGDNDWKYGQKFFIAAQAQTDSGNKSEIAYEMAYRSVFVFDEEDGKYAGGGEGEIVLKDLNKRPKDAAGNVQEGARPDGGVARIWIRGGDAETGPVTTAGFPLSWDEKDYGGVALLTQKNSIWYYVTWELTTTAYIGIMAGVTVDDSGTLGPKEWCYGKNSFVPFKKWYPLFPGESRYTTAEYGSDIWDVTRGGFGFKKTTVDRDGNQYNYDSSGSGGGGGSGKNPSHEPDNSPVSAEDAKLSGQLLAHYIDLSNGDGWVQWSEKINANVPNPARQMTLTIKTVATFTENVNSFVQVLTANWNEFIDENSTIAGATSKRHDDGRLRMYPTSVDGAITITVSAAQAEKIRNDNNQIQINGYGVKIVSITLN